MKRIKNKFLKSKSGQNAGWAKCLELARRRQAFWQAGGASPPRLANFSPLFKFLFFGLLIFNQISKKCIQSYP